eukprot:TRINITY_DN6140_c0_g1_i1.p1 TRINITY_DN6140_c0_g1~~TRINITY_DN6140_c0_g1_i1.p1  ORF type:complete len:687 (-),score=237.81 TRINITY_DN6140_c0_g1_i1:85-2145(-)
MTTTPMKIRKVILYNNGLQAFERRTEADGSFSTDLFFKEKDMQEILKSLKLSAFVSDDGQKKEVGLQTCSYEINQTGRAGSSIAIPESNSVTGMLLNLKGHHVILYVQKEKVEGVLLGVETLRTNDNNILVLNLLVGNSVVRAVEFRAITEIIIVDENARKELQHALEVYMSEKKKEMKKLTVFSHGEGKRTVSARYSLQAKEWKTSYRVNMSPTSPKATFDAFAIIENTQNEDWDDVKLTLVAGAPFLKAETNASEGTNSSGGSMSITIRYNGNTLVVRVDPHDLIEEVKKKICTRESVLRPENQRLIFAGKQIYDGRTLADYNITDGATVHCITTSTAVSSGAGRGQQFRMADQGSLSYFRIKYPIHVKRSQSALIPILHAPVTLQHVALFNPEIRSGNPMSAVLFENTTGYTLEGGSIAFSNGTTFLGENNILQMKPKDETLIPYAVELGIDVTVARDTTILPLKRVEVEKGEITFYKDRKQRTVYTFMNSPKKELHMFLDHTFLEAWLLVDTDQPIDITDRYYRFEFTLEPKDAHVFQVTEKTTDAERLSILQQEDEEIRKWSKILSDEVYSAVLAAKNTSKMAQQVMLNIMEKESEIRECKIRQDDLRKNIAAIGVEGKKYIQELSREEDKLVSLLAGVKADRSKKRDLDVQAQKDVEAIKFVKDFTKESKEEVTVEKSSA